MSDEWVWTVGLFVEDLRGMDGEDVVVLMGFYYELWVSTVNSNVCGRESYDCYYMVWFYL